MRSLCALLWIEFFVLVSVASAAGSGRGIAYFGMWPHHVAVFDAAQEKIVDSIDLKTDVPYDLFFSYDKTKLFAYSLNDSAITTIDCKTNKVISSFSLNSGDRKIRVKGLVADSTGKYLYGVVFATIAKIDRFEIEPTKFVVIDLAQKAVIRAVDYPKDESTSGFHLEMKVSPDGKYLYIFREKVLVVETSNFTVVKKIDLAKPAPPGMESLSLEGSEDPNEEPGTMVSVFESSDPYVHRRVFGIARIDLSNLTFDFTPVGPAMGKMSALRLTPDRKIGYTTVVQGSTGSKRAEFWAFDMQTRKVIARHEFPARTRFYFALSADGSKILIYGAGFDVQVYDAKTFEPRGDFITPADITTEMVTLPLGPEANQPAKPGRSVASAR
jgi:hypothetical protein